MTMTLRDLEARLMRVVDDTTFAEVDRIEDADGVWFLCPQCFAENGGNVGTHAVVCWTPRVPQSVPPTPGRWILAGTSLDDLTLAAGESGQSSVGLKTSPCRAHFLVQGGAIAMLPPYPP